MRRLTAIRIGASTLVLAAAALLSPAPAGATGNLDQTLPGNPGCSTFNFPTAETSSGHMRQEFVPRGDALASLDVCVSAASATVVTVSVLTGSASSPGSLLASVQANLSSSSPTYLHVELGSVPVTAGDTYVIDVQGGSAVSWYGNAPGGIYPYDPGISNACPAIESFAFRTFIVGEQTVGQSSAVKRCGAAATPTPPATATPTRTATPSPTRTPTPTLTATSTATLAPSATPARPTVIAGTSPSPAATNTAGANATPGGTPPPGTATARAAMIDTGGVAFTLPEVGHGPGLDVGR